MSKLGKIFLEENNPNPRIIISCEGSVPRAIEIVEESDISCVRIPKEDIAKLDYEGKQKDSCIARLNRNICIRNLQIKEIGSLTEAGYCKLLRKYISYQASIGAKEPSYLEVRDDVHKQLIRIMDKGIY